MLKNREQEPKAKEKKEKKEKPKKEKEPLQPQYYRSAAGEETLNYCVYYMTPLEKLLYFALAFVLGAAVGLLFYGGIGKDDFGDPTRLTYVLNTAIVLVCGTVTGKVFLPIRNKQLLESRQKRLKSQFRDMLEALMTALSTGKNVRDSFLSVYDDLKNQYDEDAYILKELEVIIHGQNNGINLEEILKDFGRRSGCEDIQDFAEVFEICYRKGGNIRDTVRNTCDILGDKMSVAEDIETTVAGSKNDQYIMLVMPIVLIAMIKLSSEDFAANFTTGAGLISTTAAVAMFVFSYFLGTKILEIKL